MNNPSRLASIMSTSEAQTCCSALFRPTQSNGLNACSSFKTVADPPRHSCHWLDRNAAAAKLADPARWIYHWEWNAASAIGFTFHFWDSEKYVRYYWIQHFRLWLSDRSRSVIQIEMWVLLLNSTFEATHRRGRSVLETEIDVAATVKFNIWGYTPTEVDLYSFETEMRLLLIVN